MKDIKKINLTVPGSLVIMLIIEYFGFLNYIPQPALRQLIAQILLAVPAIIYISCSDRSFADTVGLGNFSPKSMLFTIGLCIILRPVLTFVNAVSMQYSAVTVNNTMISFAEKTPLPVALLTVGLAPAFFEELAYRGVVYNGYRRYNRKTAVFLSAFLFGVMHGNLNQFTYAFAMGIVFALLFEASGTILAPMLVHFCVNASSLLIIYLTRAFSPEAYEDLVANASARPTLSVTFGVYLPLAAVACALSFFLLRALASENGRLGNIKIIFMHKSTSSAVSLGRMEPETELIEYIPGMRFYTLPLVFAIASGVLLIVASELDAYGIAPWM